MQNNPPRKSLLPVLLYPAVGFVIVLGLLLLKACYTTDARQTASKVRTEHRTLAVALEAYHAEWGHYPAGIPMNARKTVVHDSRPLLTLDLAAMGIQAASVGFYSDWEANNYKGEPDYRDWFTARIYHRSALPYRYYPKGNGWILFSTGPDGDYDIDPETWYDPNIAQPSTPLLVLAGTYDPTNGTESDGDLWRVKQ